MGAVFWHSRQRTCSDKYTSSNAPRSLLGNFPKSCRIREPSQARNIILIPGGRRLQLGRPAQKQFAKMNRPLAFAAAQMRERRWHDWGRVHPQRANAAPCGKIRTAYNPAAGTSATAGISSPERSSTRHSKKVGGGRMATHRSHAAPRLYSHRQLCCLLAISLRQ